MEAPRVRTSRDKQRASPDSLSPAKNGDHDTLETSSPGTIARTLSKCTFLYLDRSIPGDESAELMGRRGKLEWGRHIVRVPRD